MTDLIAISAAEQKLALATEPEQAQEVELFAELARRYAEEQDDYEMAVRAQETRGDFLRFTADDMLAVLEEQAAQGWRLLQIFAPSTAWHTNAAFFELIFEKPVG